MSSDIASLLREAARTPRVAPAAADIDRAGSRIGKFLIRSELGRGGMGIVYAAEDTKLRRDVALKVLPSAFVDEERRRRFLREARAAARVSHPNVTAVYEVGEDAGNTFIAMEYVEGNTLRALLRRSGGAPLPLRRALRIARAITEGLEIAHIAGIVHRDLKPENVMLTRNGVVKILDFGLAKLSAGPLPSAGLIEAAPFEEAGPLVKSDEGGGSISLENVTAEGRLLGTPSYMSPEQVKGKPLDLRSDLFALGVILYEMVTGVRPFSGETVVDVLIAVDRDEPELASNRNPSVPPELDRLLVRALAKRPENRCEGAFEIRAAIDRLLCGAALAHESLEPPGAASLVNAAGERITPIPASADRDSGWPPSSGPNKSFTNKERGFIAVVVIDAASPRALEAPAPEELSRLLDELRREALQRGGRPELLSGGIFAVTFANRFVVTDQAACSARAALALAAIARSRPIALVMGRADSTEEQRSGDALAHATAMVARRSARQDNPSEISIMLGEMAHSLLGAQFDVRRGEDGPLLAGELPVPDMARTLLGKPTRCVGRDRELATLASLFNECVEEPLGRAVLVVAPAGMGKSRLMHEMLRVVRQQRGGDVGIWIGPGDPLCVDSAFGILGHALADECGILVGEPLASRQAKLAARVARSVAASDSRRITEFLGELIGAPFQEEGSALLQAARKDAALMNEQMRQAFLDFIGAETSRRPLLIVLEDLHWSDVPTVRFIDAALRAHGDKPWMVLALARPEVHDRFPKLWAGRDVHQIQLKELSRKASEQLVREVLGSAATDTIVDRVVGMADGHAFYLEELIRASAEGQRHGLPATVIAMVQARLRDLDGNARRLLRAASVFGETFWQSAISGLAGGATDDPLAMLVDREIIVRRLSSRFPSEREYAFRHALLREGAYAMLTDADLHLGHRLAAEWLEQHGERDAMVLAEHFERGGERSRAASFYAEAAAQDLRAGDVDTAIACAERGLGCAPNENARMRMLEVVCEGYAWRGELERVMPYAQELIQLAPPGSAAHVAAANVQMGAALFSGRFSDFLDVVDAVLATDLSPDAAPAAAAMAMTGSVILTLTGQIERGQIYLHKLETLSGRPGIHEPCARGAMHFTRAFSSAGVNEDPWSSLHEADASRACFEEAGNRKRAGIARILIGINAWFLGAADRAERELSDPSAMDPDLPEMAAQRVSILVDLMIARGDLEGARLAASALVERGRSRQIRTDEGFGRYSLAKALHAAGDYASAEREATLAGEILVMPVYRQWPLSALSAILRSQGRTAEAVGAARQAVLGCELLRNFGYRGAEVRLEYALALSANGNYDEARRRIAIASEQIFKAASLIDDAAARRAFLDNAPAVAETLKLARAWLPDGHPYRA